MINDERLEETSTLIPPNNSLIYEFALIKAYIEPIIRNLLEESNESITISIKEIKDWSISKDKKHLNQDLKIQYVDVFIKDKKIIGDDNTNTCTIIYLSEYENSRFKSPTDINPFIIPSNENKSKELSPIEIVEFR